MEYINCEVKNSVAVVTINRPETLNALNPAVLGELYTIMDKLDNDDSVSAVIITGAGEKAFVAGADIPSMCDMNLPEAMVFTNVGHRTMNRIAEMKKATIAAINGYALGGGCELAMACDIRVASKNARMGIPETALGVIPGFGGTQRLPRLVGMGMALELLMTGRQCDAEECKEIGLVEHVVEREELLPYCIKMAEKIARNSPVAIALGKECVRYGLETSLDDGLRMEKQAFAAAFSFPDQTEGMSAFMEKRKPSF